MVRAVTPIPFVKARFFDRCGKPLAGGKVHTYAANTTTPKVTYKDPYGLTPNTNPIILDAAGEADIYLDGTYRIRITDRNDVLVNDVEKIGSWFSDNLQDTLDNISGAMNEALKPVLQNLDNAINAAAAAGAGANGWTALLVADESGMTQQQVNDKTAIFYNTVADMVADTKLKAGKAVITHGYYAPNDGGGARYLIKDTATDYSIPVANNLHAVFADSFDIRKFGIRDNATLDQTTEIQRMVNYADSRVYEIDFLGYHIMSPKTVCRYYTGTRTGKGMGFSYVHKIKNLTISNDKTKTLMHGDTCIFFLPKENGFGNFVLDNVTFDPFVADYKILMGDGDGHMHGFSAEWHEDMQIGWPQNQQIQTGYNIIIDNINFISPAVCYNLSTNLRCNEIRITNAKGEYWGIYLWHWCDRLYAENVHGVWRDDLHANANPRRVLVTNLFQEEQEVGGGSFAYTQEIQIFNNISCIKKTDGSYYSTIVRQGMGKPFLKTLIIENNKGNIVWYMGNPEQIDSRYSIGNLVIDNFTDGSIQLMCAVDKVAIKNTIVNKELVFLHKYLFNDIYLENSKFYADVGIFAGCTINKFKAVDCLFGNTIYGMVYDDALIKDIHLINPTIYVPTNGVFMYASFNNLLIQGGILKTIDKPYFYKLIVNNGINTNNVSKVIIDSFICYVRGGDGGYLLVANNGVSIDAEVVNSKFLSIPNFILGSSGSLVYRNNLPEVKATLAYNPPSLATSTQQLTTVTLTGAKVGDIVAVSFNQPLQGTRMWAEVTAANTVTVYHRNDTGAAVDLPSGTLTVKIV